MLIFFNFKIVAIASGLANANRDEGAARMSKIFFTLVKRFIGFFLTFICSGRFTKLTTQTNCIYCIHIVKYNTCVMMRQS